MNNYSNLPTPSPIELLGEEQKSKLIKRQLKKGDALYNEGETPQGLYFVSSGLLGLTRLSENGAESLLRVFPAKSYLGHRSYLASEPYHATAQALMASEVLFVPKEIARDLLINQPELLLSISIQLATDLKVAETRLNDMVGKRAFCRVTEALVFLKHKNEDFPWTRREIGEFSGVKTETVSRVLSELEELGHIKKEGRQILIKDEEALLQALRESQN